VFSIATTNHEINEQIRDAQVRLISESGEQLGIVSSEEALRIATEAGYDLVKIAPNSTPPVCRIMDYGKFRFEQTKKEKEAKKAPPIDKELDDEISAFFSTLDDIIAKKKGDK
jgi:translation initiation factor IF-3